MIFTHLMCTCISIGRAFNISSHPQYHAISKQQNIFVGVVLGDYFISSNGQFGIAIELVTCIEDIYYVLLYYIHSPNTVSHLYIHISRCCLQNSHLNQHYILLFELCL